MLEHDYAGRRCVSYSETCRERPLYCFSRRTLCLFAVAFIACLAACGGSTKPPVPGPPPETQHLYTAGRYRPRCSVRAATHELNTDSNLSLATASDVSAVAVDSAGNVATGDLCPGNITIFNGPITASASPSAAFKNGTSTLVDNLAFNSAGDLFATTNGNSINVFTHPLTSASTPSQIITSANLSKSVGVVLDSANNLIVSNLPAYCRAATCWFTPRLTPVFPSPPRWFPPLPIAKWRSAARSCSSSPRRSAHQESTFTICQSPRPACPHFSSAPAFLVAR